ncbi:MAG: cbb3-type cytochrome c oxidase subunit 3 [Geminicoccaceae bacterium]
MEGALGMLRQFWQVWLFLLFVGIVIWVYWPGRKKEMDDDAMIPFRDEEK